MSSSFRLVLLLSLGVLSACASSWQAGPSALADPRLVAQALGDPPPSERAMLAALPDLEEPGHPRPCCAFGMDMHVDFAGIEVPLFEVGNVTEPSALSRHAYTLPLGAPEVEGNGLIYTCRGGWIDTAHVRENADVQLFLTLRIAQALETGTTIVIPGHGAPTTIVIDAIAAHVLSDESPLAIASVLAGWATSRIGLWHEIATWYGYQMIAGFSEQPSAFSPEDLYSNALGIRLATALIEARDFTTTDEYQLAIEAFIEEALHRLEAQPIAIARGIMQSLDGRWWDSTQRLPNTLLVMRRRFPEEGPMVRPWRAESAFEGGIVPEPLASACGGSRPRPLRIDTRLGDRPVSDFVHITFEPEDWADESFPFPEAGTRQVSERFLDALVVTTREAMSVVHGEGFDAPR